MGFAKRRLNGIRRRFFTIEISSICSQHFCSHSTPDNSSLTKIRQRLPMTVSERVFEFILKVAAVKKLLNSKTAGVDSTTLEAKGAMGSIVGKDDGDDRKEYLREQAGAEGVEIKGDEDLRCFDQQRKEEGKKTFSPPKPRPFPQLQPQGE